MEFVCRETSYKQEAILGDVDIEGTADVGIHKVGPIGL